MIGATAWQKVRHQYERESSRDTGSRYLHELRAEVSGKARTLRFPSCGPVSEGGEAAWRRFVDGGTRKRLILALVELRKREREPRPPQTGEPEHADEEVTIVVEESAPCQEAVA